MRVIIEVMSGQMLGRKIVLEAGQMLQVGRTQWSDVALPHDIRMSGRHFQLRTDQNACYIEDLKSSNGTFVNRTRIAGPTLLNDGDEIRAGQTQFLVHIQPGSMLSSRGASAPEASRPSPPRPETPDVPQFAEFPALAELEIFASSKSAPAPRPPQTEVRYTVEQCDTGLMLCRGSIDQIRPARLAERLAQFLPVYLIVDFKNLGSACPGDLASPEYLFDWLDPTAAALVSPVVVPQDDYLVWPNLLDQGWGSDGVICLFSNLEKGAMMEHLRRSCHAKPGSNDAMVGYCWPSVLAPLLMHYTRAFVRDLLAGIEAVLVELPDLPDTWQVYGSGHVVKMLDQLGFRQQSPGRGAGPPGAN